MADEFQLGSGNWWDTSRSRFDGETTSASIPTTLSAIASFGWPTEMVEMKPRSNMDSTAVSGGSMALHDDEDQSGAGGVLADHSALQMMGLGLPSQGLDWNQALLGEKGESSFRSMIQEDLSSNASNFQESSSSQQHWTQKLYSGGASPDDSSVQDFRQMNRGFSLDQPPQFTSSAAASSNDDGTITSGHNLTTSFQLDSAGAYGLLLPENQSHHGTMNFPYPSPNAVGLIPSWNKFPPSFLRTSPPPKLRPPPPPPGAHLHFTNNTPFWNASAPTAAVTDARSSFFPDIQTQIPQAPSFDEKPKNSSEPRDSSTKKSSSETSNKRPRNETPSALPAFKVRKEKMGDRITALQQLVSPFGKTDTASVLSEAIEYIKFLHEQVSVLSTPYMKNGAPIQHQQNPDKSNKDPAEGPRQDLRSRGLCLVPVSSTFPMTHETTVDFWTPTFGGSFR